MRKLNFILCAFLAMMFCSCSKDAYLASSQLSSKQEKIISDLKQINSYYKSKGEIGILSNANNEVKSAINKSIGSSTLISSSKKTSYSIIKGNKESSIAVNGIIDDLNQKTRSSMTIWNALSVIGADAGGYSTGAKYGRIAGGTLGGIFGGGIPGMILGARIGTYAGGVIVGGISSYIAYRASKSSNFTALIPTFDPIVRDTLLIDYDNEYTAGEQHNIILQYLMTTSPDFSIEIPAGKTPSETFFDGLTLKHAERLLFDSLYYRGVFSSQNGVLTPVPEYEMQQTNEDIFLNSITSSLRDGLINNDTFANAYEMQVAYINYISESEDITSEEKKLILSNIILSQYSLIYWNNVIP